jgi:DNA adenine methylase
VTFFRALRERPDDLERALRLTPYSREEFEDYRKTWAEGADDVDRARRWYVRTRAAFGGSSETSGWGAEITGRQRGGTRPGAFAASIDTLEVFAERFRRVQVDHVDWRAVFDRYDGPGACFYLDPPYHPETRGRVRGCYANELDAAGHEHLVERAIALRGSALISGYDHPSYEPLVAAGYERLEFAHHATVSRRLEGRGPRLEIVWRRVEAGADHAPPLWAHGAMEACG